MVPNHIAMMIEGSRLWEKEKGQQFCRGYLATLRNLREMIKYIFRKRVKILSLYIYTCDEEEKKTNEEQKYLLKLFNKVIRKYIGDCCEENIKVVFSSKREGLSTSLLNAINLMEEQTKNNTGGILNLCLNYSGRDEILDMTKKIAQEVVDGTLEIKKINEKTIASHLYQQLPEVDFLITTNNTYRLKNFMLYQLAHAEIYLTDTLFPDFDKMCFDRAMIAYNARLRTRGYYNG